MTKIEKTIELNGKTLTLTTGELAGQAAGAVTARMGDTVVLATVAVAPLKTPLDYFPLTVEYLERLYAGGRIKGSRWVKREGRPTDEEILSARLIDRSIRPLFPKSYKREVQVVVTVLSVDGENNPAVLGAIATSAAVHLSGLPWKGPVAPLSVGLIDGKYILNPLNSEVEASKLDLTVSVTNEAILMIEAGANEATEEEVLGGVKFAAKEAEKVLNLIDALAKEAGRERESYAEEKPPAELVSQVKKLVQDKIPSLVASLATHEGGQFDELAELTAAVNEKVTEDEKKFVPEIINQLKKEYLREQILKKGIRPDGRKLTEIRPLSAQVGVLPRVHGSGLFSRGQTQVLSVATLGAKSMGQLLESAEGEEEKRYMHHYSMPPYATGETGKVGFPSRREIGHGALAERALLPVLPSEDEFPYAIRVVSEVMSSNGSTSMASVCGSTLSLMDAGVPLKSPVAGIAMGLIIEGKNVAILSDIMGLEDFDGDMDFKVAGTAKGITALQLDVKTLTLTPEILGRALEQAKAGRNEIMKVILAAIPEPRKSVSQYAPKIKVVKIPIDKIGEFIGPSGRSIKKLMAETGTQIDVDDDGSVSISGVDAESLQKAVSWVEGFAKEVVPGEVYEGEVKRVLNFGAFVEVLPGKEGMVHVSDMGQEGFVKSAEDVVKVGDKLRVRVKEIDEMGRINLSMNMDPAKDAQIKAERQASRAGRRDFSSNRRFDRGGFSRTSRRFSRGGERSSGPHFPTSRLIGGQKKDFTR